MDNAGHITYDGIVVQIDSLAPNLDVTITGENGENGWFITPPSVSLSATDATSGLAGILYQVDGNSQAIYISPLTFTREGLYTVQAYAVDYAQHITTRTFQVGYDITPPQTNAILSETEDGMTITLNRWDGVSGYALTRVAINGVWQDYHAPITISEKGVYWVQYFTVDFAGNIEAEKITSFTIADAGVVITQNPPVIDVIPPVNPPNTPPFETRDDFPPNLGDGNINIFTTPPDFSDDNRILNNGGGVHTTNTNTTTLSDNPRVSRLPFIREGDKTTNLSDVFPLESHTPPQKNPVRVISPIEYVDHPVAFEPIPSTSVVYTTPPQPKPTTSSPLDVTMLAVLGMTMAGAGVMKSQTAISKQKEQIQADSLAQAQLASAKAQQNVTASTNWAQNQAMQANAYQQVVNQVTQSEANQIHVENFNNWQRDVQQKRIEEIMAIILSTTVSITAFDKDGKPNRGLGTIANNNGQQVLVTHDHFDITHPIQRNTCTSLASLQSDFPWIYIEGSNGGKLFDSHDLDIYCPSIGVIFLSLKNGGDFDVTQAEATIAFNYFPTENETVHYAYLPGWNKNYDVGNSWDLSQFGISPGINDGVFQPFLPVDVKTQPVSSINGLNIIVEYAKAGPGDSGGGLFNENGELIGVFQTELTRQNFEDNIANIGYYLNRPVHPEPSAMDNQFNVILGPNP